MYLRIYIAWCMFVVTYVIRVHRLASNPGQVADHMKTLLNNIHQVTILSCMGWVPDSTYFWLWQVTIHYVTLMP